VCTAGALTCGGLILIILQLVLIAVVTLGFFVIKYQVDRDEDLRLYAASGGRAGRRREGGRR
jgi:hypothetical protein